MVTLLSKANRKSYSGMIYQRQSSRVVPNYNKFVCRIEESILFRQISNREVLQLGELII